jgi:predicted nicotinamide N-methyase
MTQKNHMPHSNVSAQSLASKEFAIDISGRVWRVERPADLESLWEAMAADLETPSSFEQDERLPYWVEIWPASLLLCAWLGQRRRDIAGRPCLDLGCGLGLTALVASQLGATVVGMDYEWDALVYARRNQAANLRPGERPPSWTLMDWRRSGFKPRSFPFIWGGDVMYEKRFIEPVAAFLEEHLAEDGAVWLAAPERKVLSPFEEHISGLGWEGRKVASDRAPHVTTEGPPVKVNIWEFKRRR